MAVKFYKKQVYYSFIAVLLFILIGCISTEGKKWYNESFRFVILGDRTGNNFSGIYKMILKKSLQENADFYITVGDQIKGYTHLSSLIKYEWEEYLKILETTVTQKTYLTPGNHDIWDNESEKLWKQYTGQGPNYSFSHKGVHVTILDTSRWESADKLPDTYIKWLKKDLSKHKKARYTFVFFHIPFWYNTLDAGTYDTLHQIFKENGVDAVFNGHFHQYGTAEYDGIIYTIIGSSGGSYGGKNIQAGKFFHYAVVDVTQDTFTLTIVPLFSDARYDRTIVKISDLKSLK